MRCLTDVWTDGQRRSRHSTAFEGGHVCAVRAAFEGGHVGAVRAASEGGHVGAPYVRPSAAADASQVTGEALSI